MLFIILCVVFVPFGFVSVEATCLTSKEVDTLRVIGSTLGYKRWDFKEDPCTVVRVVNKTNDDWVSDHKLYDDTTSCGLEPNATICHVVAVSLKGLPGTLPPEFANLRYLKNIDLTYNFLNGTIPIEWGFLEQVTHISLLGNRITGSLPKELGNIRTLAILTVEDNLMSGVIPMELGNLASIEALFLNSNYFTGELPASFASLTNMQQFRIGSNNFSGKIPDYIGKWKNLSLLSIQGSGLEGPIPSTITLLTNLSDLRISDLKGPDTFCPPFSNNTSMKKLILRSCNLIGQLPESLSKSLKLVDLSFNKFNGTIPQEFIALKNADYIYLTGNLLSGSVPDWMLQQGKNIDLSYNNFTPDNSSGFRCQIRNTNLFASSADNITKVVSCLGNDVCSTRSSNLYINCGGKKLLVGDKAYESDMNPGGASYFSITGDRWGFSNTGNFLDDGQNNDTYIVTNTSGVRMNITKLYMSARISALSLTYYGFCMLNGSYIVSLHFAEIIFTNDRTYRSLGRRVFDIYIQGRLVQKDFDISVQAGGVGKMVVKNYTVNVMTTLEIRLCWAGNGTLYIPIAGVYGPLISAISVNPNVVVQGNKKSVPVGTVAGIVVGAVCLIALSLGVLWWWGYFGRRDTMELELNCYTITFTLRQLKTATNNFDAANKIGEGGFGSVYKGVLPNGTLIAVKQLSSKSRQGSREFMNELGMISALQHPNLVTLHGCCIEGSQLLLAYEYMENNSLARALFGPEEWQLELNWRTRYMICVGIAKGLAFLHEESRLKIVHRDIKATNVLLDKNLNAKISDFGLAKLDEEDNTHISTRIAGTYGYMAPEYALRGYLTDKADVYSYGIVLLEIVSGMANTVDRTKENHFILLDRAISLNQTNNLIDLVDPKLGSEYDIQEMMVVINIALACTAITSTDRPTMSSVVRMLEGRIVPRAFAVEKSISMTEIDTEKFMKKLESKNWSQMQEISITCSNSSSSAVDLYPEDLVSDCLQKRDNEANRLLS